MATVRDNSGDTLLWIGAGAVAAMGLAWLVIAAPWSEPAAPAAEIGSAARPATASSELGARAAAAPGDAARDGPSAEPSDPLRMARLAFESGMLIEPDRYSAWTLYGQALDADPQNGSARDGLLQVAEALLQRGRTALEQGRYESARELVGMIAARLPEHAGAAELAEAVAIATAPPPPPSPAPPTAAVPAAGEPAAAAPAVAAAARITELHAAFRDAMARNAVLAPPGTSARDLVEELISLAPEHELAQAAREMLVTEMLDRSAQSLEALDIDAARTWIDAAEPLTRERARIDEAHTRLTEHLVAAESQKLLPASELIQTRYVAPAFPSTALTRGIEGWVDLEFTVSPEGRIENVVVTDASHQRYFRSEAVAAAEAWEFEPAVFMGRAIPRRSYTRVAFVID